MKNDVFAYFNPRTLCGVRRAYPRRILVSAKFQSTHPLRGATIPVAFDCHASIISIHAPLAGCDSSLRSRHVRRCISIHAPLAGCDPLCGL